MYLIQENLPSVDKVQECLEDVRRDCVQRDTLLFALDGQLRTKHSFEIRRARTKDNPMGVKDTVPRPNLHIAESGLVSQAV